MFILTVAPFVAIPRPQDQYLQYFSRDPILPGVIVEVRVQKSNTLAVVYACASADALRMELRTSAYALKAVGKQITHHEVISPSMREFAGWLSDYYYAPLGLVLRRMIPRKKTLLAKLELPRTPSPQKLTLVPEHIILTEQNPEEAVLFHSGLSVKERGAIWQDVYRGRIGHIAGSRGAFFLPFANLSHITIEHAESTSHVSWDQNPHIDVRRAALHLHEKHNTNVEFRVQNPLFDFPASIQKRCKSTSKRAKSVVVDMRQELRGGNTSVISKPLQTIIRAAGQDEKILLFINRKGFSSGLLCRDCGYVHTCTQCEIPYIYHIRERILRCHHCARKETPPDTCPNCGGARIKYMGSGTQRVEEELSRIAPDRTVIRIDSDNAPTHKEQKELFKEFKHGADILVGTQLALREELLPPITYAGIITLDPLLSLPDYRISERVYAVIDMLCTITQKTCLLQTYRPETPVFRWALAGEWNAFAQHEEEMRRALRWPPYSQIIKVAYKHKDPKTAEREAHTLKTKFDIHIRHIGAESHAILLGPSPAFVPRVGGFYAWYILIKWSVGQRGPSNMPLRNRLLDIIPRGWDIDIDPIDIV